MTTAPAPAIRYTARNYDTLLQELVALAKRVDPSMATDLTQSQFGMSLLKLMAYVGEQAAYTQDANVGEVFPSTARLRSSLYRFARSVGYNPATAQSAIVQMNAMTVPSQVTSYGGVIRAGNFIAGANGLNYEVVDDVAIPVGATIDTASIILREGATHREQFQSSLLPNQEFTTVQGDIDFNSWKVYVGAISSLNQWTQVSAVTFENTDAKVYEASITDTGRLLIRFGDGVTGGQIPQDNVTVVYRTTAGLQGNSPANTIRGTFAVDIPGTNDVVTIEYANTTDQAAGGEQPEALDELRRNIPAYISSAGAAIKLNSIESAAAKLPGVSLALADVLSSGYGGCVCKVYIWASEQVEFQAELANGAAGPLSTYVRYTQAGIAQAASVSAQLRDKTVWNTLLTVLRPTVANADVYLAPVRVVDGVDRNVVAQGIVDAVVEAFQAKGGVNVRLGDITQAVESVEGVTSSLIDRIVFENDVRAHASGFIRITNEAQNIPDGTYVSIDDGNRGLTFEFTSVLDGNGNPIITIPNAIPVYVGVTLDAAVSAFITAVNTRMDVVASRNPDETQRVIRLEHTKAGTEYNRPIMVGRVSSTTDIQVSGLSGGTDTVGQGKPAQGAIIFLDNAQPANGDYITIKDVLLTKRFEFDDGGGVTSGSIPVIIGPDVQATQANLLTAINSSGLQIVASEVVGNAFITTQLIGQPGIEANRAIEYTTGSVLLCYGMGSGTGHVTPNRDDMRRDMQPRRDQWPVGAYIPGTSQRGGILPYRPLTDMVKVVKKASRNRYDDSHAYNNTIQYDSVIDTTSEAQAINLRRLVFSFA